MSEAALRAYLLGKLDDSEVVLVESRLIEDPDLFSQMETAEDDLFDAYARGALDEGDRVLFLRRFGASAGRRRFAQAFVKQTPHANVVPFIRRGWVQFAVAASLVLVVGTMLMRRTSETTAVSPAPPTLPAVSALPVPAPIVARVALSLGTSRAAGAPSRVPIAAAATQIDLAIRLNPADKYAVYAIEIRSQANNIIWGNAALTSSDESGELVVHAVVPAERLPAGSYEVSVRGGAAAASLEDLGYLTVEVSRAQ